MYLTKVENYLQECLSVTVYNKYPGGGDCEFCCLSVGDLAIEYGQNEPHNTYHKYNIYITNELYFIVYDVF